jgi:hypothetical protein
MWNRQGNNASSTGTTQPIGDAAKDLHSKQPRVLNDDLEEATIVPRSITGNISGMDFS